MQNNDTNKQAMFWREITWGELHEKHSDVEQAEEACPQCVRETPHYCPDCKCQLKHT